MATVRKVLGQALPAADTNVDLYTVPASTSTVVSSIMVANQSASLATFSVAVRPGGAALADKHWIYRRIQMPGNDSFAGTLGLTLAAGDVVTVRSNAATTSFSLFGEETS